MGGTGWNDGRFWTVEGEEPPGEGKRPNVTGQFVWLPTNSDAEGAEEINIPTALSGVERPLTGGGFSFRRFLFFAGGHKRLMKDVAGNLRELLM
jgi:hypothetical protein